MKAPLTKNPLIRIAVVGTDPLQLMGFRSVFHSERDFELISSSLSDVETQQNIDLVLLGDRSSQNPFDMVATLKATRPNLRIIVIGSGTEEEPILKAIALGAKGYVDASASSADFGQAIRVVNQGSVWAPRRVLSVFIERVNSSPRNLLFPDRMAFTIREKEVLQLLTAGRSNKEIAAKLGIEERTVKAHVSKLLRKNGVQNRIALSVHAVTHSLVPQQKPD
jgi:DNA-binding NarL/FixJ family response regulator